MAEDRLHSKHEPRLQSGKIYSMLDLLGASITCDVCGSWQRLPSLDAMGAREEAHARGWRVVDGKDLCKRCLSRGQCGEDDTQA